MPSKNVLIKNVDDEVYKNFKIRAIEKGLRIDEAFNEAVTLWLDHQSGITPRKEKQQKNELAYRLLKKNLEKEYRGKWVCIIDGELAAMADNREGLLEKLKVIKNNDDPALFFQIGMKARRVTYGYRRVKE